ncbi:MAG: hypothetical protein ACI4V4_02720 [Eubacterium sp.]
MKTKLYQILGLYVSPVAVVAHSDDTTKIYCADERAERMAYAHLSYLGSTPEISVVYGAFATTINRKIRNIDIFYIETIDNITVIHI